MVAVIMLSTAKVTVMWMMCHRFNRHIIVIAHRRRNKNRHLHHRIVIISNRIEHDAHNVVSHTMKNVTIQVSINSFCVACVSCVLHFSCFFLFEFPFDALSLSECVGPPHLKKTKFRAQFFFSFCLFFLLSKTSNRKRVLNTRLQYRRPCNFATDSNFFFSNHEKTYFALYIYLDCCLNDCGSYIVFP